MDDSRKSHTDRRVARTKRAIYEALMRLAEREDYRKITVTALAKEADIDRKTFYLHYSSVDDVVSEALRNRARELTDKLKGISFLEGDSVNVAGLFDALGPIILPDFISSKETVRHFPPELILDSMQNEFINVLAEEHDRRLEALGPLLEYCVTYVVSGAFAVYRRWLLSDSEIPLDQISAMTATLAFNGTGELIGGESDDEQDDSENRSHTIRKYRKKQE